MTNHHLQERDRKGNVCPPTSSLSSRFSTWKFRGIHIQLVLFSYLAFWVESGCCVDTG